ANDYDGSSRVRWCSLAYWELCTRVGRVFPVSKSVENVFGDMPHGDGLSLGTLATQNEAECEVVKRTRAKIGFGLTLSREDDGVWLYNRGDFAVFVNSPTLTGPNRTTTIVHKVQPGYSVKIFDYAKSACYQSLQNPELLDGPIDHNSVRISFVKGWGPKYSRQVITSCPCWLEVLLVPR
uniref:MH2 domain-containing protein n=1 Tax=Strigamia maritima TaxID=126957 RepID=T1J649_STRMM